MSKQADRQIDANMAINSCVVLIEMLATNATLPDDQVVAAMGKLKPASLLIMFCAIRSWALDALARLSGIGSVSDDWEEKFEELNSQLRKLARSDLSDLAKQTRDGPSLLLLSSALDALRLISTAIEMRLDPLPIGSAYVKYRDTQAEESLEDILRLIRPSRDYYRINDASVEDRSSDIKLGFFELLNKLQRAPVGNWKGFPHTVLRDHRKAPHPEWENRASAFLDRDIEEALREDLPILSGKLEIAPLQMRTVVRDKYLRWCPEITLSTGEAVTAKNVDLEKISSGKMRELGEKFDPEVQLGDREDRAVLERKLQELAKNDPQLYWALMQTEGDKSKAAKLLGISRPTLYARLDKTLKRSST